MLNKEQISVRQFSILVLLFTIGTAIILIPSMLAMYAKQNAWISAILGMVMGLIVVWLFSLVGQFFEGKTIIQAIQTTLGKWIGAIVSLFFIGFTLLLSSLLVTDISYFVKNRLLDSTPLEAIEFLFLAMVILGVRYGLETLARTAELLLPILFVLFLIFVLGLLPDIDIENLKPILENGFLSIWKSSSIILAFPFADLIVFLMLTPYLSNVSRIKSGFLSGTLIGGSILCLMTLLCILVLGGETTANQVYPVYTLAKKIDIGAFIQRIEVVMAGIWVMSIFFKLSVCLYVLVLSLKQLFKLREIKCLTIPIGMLLVPISKWISPNDSVYLSVTSIWMTRLQLGMVFLPLLIWAVAWIKRKVKKNQEMN